MSRKLGHDATRRLRHRLTFVRVDRAWFVKVDGAVTRHETIDSAAAQIATFMHDLYDCGCATH